MRRLRLTPSQAQYAAKRGNQVTSIEVDGGLSRRRASFSGAAARVDVGWTLPPLEFEYLDAFYRTATNQAVETFEVELVLDSWSPAIYTARFVPNTYGVSGVSGMATIVTAQLEVRPPKPDPAYDNGVMDLYEEFEDDLPVFLNELEHLVNVVMPGAIGP